VLAVRLVLYAIAVAALFLNGARSELVAALCVLPMIELYRAKHWFPYLYVVLLVFGLANIDPQFLANRFPESRVWELFNLSQSSSAAARHELTEHALRTIAEHPVLGAYASYPPGGYSHNILSAWVDLGVFGFVYMLFMLLRTAVGLCSRGWLVRPRSGQFLLAWSLICISLLLLATAKTFDDMFFGAAMGAYANYRSSQQRNKRLPEGADHVEGEGT
jgi:O-antigen ligase